MDNIVAIAIGIAIAVIGYVFIIGSEVMRRERVKKRLPANPPDTKIGDLNITKLAKALDLAATVFLIGAVFIDTFAIPNTLSIRRVGAGHAGSGNNPWSTGICVALRVQA